MIVKLNLETNEIVVPKNFFKAYDKINEQNKKMGVEPIKPVEVIKKSFEIAMADTDKYLKVNQ